MTQSGISATKHLIMINVGIPGYQITCHHIKHFLKSVALKNFVFLDFITLSNQLSERI